MNAGPLFIKAVDVDMHVPQTVIVVCGVFVIEASFEGKAGSGDVGNDPFAVPFRITVPSNGRGTKCHGRILLMAGWQLGIQGCEDVRIRGHGVDVGHWELRSTMEGESDIESWRCSRDRCVVEATSWLTVILFPFAVFCSFVLELFCFCVEFGSVTDASMAIGLSGGLFVVHDSK